MFKSVSEKIKNFSYSSLLSESHRVLMLVLWMIIFLLCIQIIKQRATIPIATVNLTEIVNQFLEAQASLKLPKPEMQKRVNRFGKQLEITINQLSKENHMVILPAEAVAAGAVDFTPEAKKKLTDWMESHL